MSSTPCSPGSTGGLPNSVMSAPAMKVRPAQTMTIACTAPSAVACLIPSCSPLRTCWLSALTGGLSTVSTATRPRLVRSTDCVSFAMGTPRWGESGPYHTVPVPTRSVPSLVAAQACEELREDLDVVVPDPLRAHRHRPVEIRGRLFLEPADELAQVIDVLPGEPRDLLVAREIRAIARRAVIGRGGLLSVFHFPRIDLRGPTHGLLRRIERREIRHVLIGELRDELGHLIVLAPPVADLDELPVREHRRLPRQRRHARNLRVAVRAMARRAHLRLRTARVGVR